jgi:hypothetical protein
LISVAYIFIIFAVNHQNTSIMAAEKKPVQATPTKPEHKFLFDTRNYILFAVGALLIILGFFMMGGGGSKDPNVFNPEIFSSGRITIAPILVLAGFVINVLAIMLKPKQ